MDWQGRIGDVLLPEDGRNLRGTGGILCGLSGVEPLWLRSWIVGGWGDGTRRAVTRSEGRAKRHHHVRHSISGGTIKVGQAICGCTGVESNGVMNGRGRVWAVVLILNSRHQPPQPP